MKKIIFVFALLAQSAFATSGIDCQAINGTMKVSTNEANEVGDNVISLSVVAPWIQKAPIVFEKFNNEVNVSTQESNAVYMASNSKAQSLTLILDNQKVEGLKLSTALLRADGQIYVELMQCVGLEDSN